MALNFIGGDSASIRGDVTVLQAARRAAGEMITHEVECWICGSFCSANCVRREGGGKTDLRTRFSQWGFAVSLLRSAGEAFRLFEDAECVRICEVA